MRKMILAGVAAALMVPGAAIAAPHGNYQQHQVRHDTRQNDRHQAKQHRQGWRAYAAPVRNWRYRPVTVGFQLQPTFYGSRYYVNDYNAFQLRAPARNQRWVRYGDDLLLVNIRTGRVIQVVQNRYW
ncbi:MAG TPA: RcnB family protein [Chthoniobacterales bacterium]|nr:RcnB family protein [Chthoniobacterales bacterium]